jgi:hypothetical protein
LYQEVIKVREYRFENEEQVLQLCLSLSATLGILGILGILAICHLDLFTWISLETLRLAFITTTFHRSRKSKAERQQRTKKIIV